MTTMLSHALEGSVPASLATYLRTAVSVLQDTTRLPITLVKVCTVIPVPPVK